MAQYLLVKNKRIISISLLVYLQLPLEIWEIFLPDPVFEQRDNDRFNSTTSIRTQ